MSRVSFEQTLIYSASVINVVDPAVCANNPCEHGGNCRWSHIPGIPFKHGYYCQCGDWDLYSGPRCNICAYLRSQSGSIGLIIMLC